MLNLTKIPLAYFGGPKVHFLIVGAQKSGTRALSQYLSTHPQLELSKKPEPHFFDNIASKLSAYNITKYHLNFELRPDMVRGECTPSYMYYKPALQRAQLYNPSLKLIAILRDPVNRAYSHWNMMASTTPHETESFERALKLEKTRIRNVPAFTRFRYSYIDRGFYSVQIKNIWQHFPKEQTLFLKSEALKSDPQECLNHVSNFLDIPKFTNVSEQRVHALSYTQPLTQGLRKKLISYYREDINEVTNLLGWNCDDWLTP